MAEAQARHRLPPRGAGPRSGILPRSEDNFRHECRGAASMSARPCGLSKACARLSLSPPTSATATSSGSGATAKPTSWAAAIPTALRRVAPRWSSPRIGRSFLSKSGRHQCGGYEGAGNVIGGGDWAEGSSNSRLRARVAQEADRLKFAIPMRRGRGSTFSSPWAPTCMSGGSWRTQRRRILQGVEFRPEQQRKQDRRRSGQ